MIKLLTSAYTFPPAVAEVAKSIRDYAFAALTTAAFTDHTSITLEDPGIHYPCPAPLDRRPFGPALTNKSSLHMNNIPSLKTPPPPVTHRIYNQWGPRQWPTWHMPNYSHTAVLSDLCEQHHKEPLRTQSSRRSNRLRNNT